MDNSLIIRFDSCVSEVTIKQLRERLKEGEEKVEAVAEVIKDSVNAKITLNINSFLASGDI